LLPKNCVVDLKNVIVLKISLTYFNFMQKDPGSGKKLSGSRILGVKKGPDRQHWYAQYAVHSTGTVARISIISMVCIELPPYGVNVTP
jgi:hypothetical protein